MFRVTTANAACDTIPSAIEPFRAMVGSIDRPFAGPGDWVELGADPCQLTDGFLDPTTKMPMPADQLVVSVLFSPPNDGPKTAIVMTAGACDDIRGALAGCDRVLGTQADCRQHRAAGPIVDIEHPRARPSNLRFQFPNTDGAVSQEEDDLGLTGPATITVTRLDDVVRGGDALHCAVAMTGCEPGAGLLACIDRLFTDGTCAGVPDTQFGRFTALPAPNNYAALCTEPSFPNGPCTGAAGGTARLTVDGEGNLLVPVDWSGVIVRDDHIPVPRLLRASTVEAAFQGLLGSIRIPGPAFLESFSPEGRKLPPLFEAQADADASDRLALFGSADAAYTVLRLNRRAVRGRCAVTGTGCAANFECPRGETCNRFLACTGGAPEPCTGDAAECSEGTCGATACTVCASGPLINQPCRAPADCSDEPGVGPSVACLPGSQSCGSDAECPGAQCGPALFDFGTRLLERKGPVILVDTQAVALDPVPLAGLIQTNANDVVNVFVREERIQRSDLDGDLDSTDPVLTLHNRASGANVPIGPGGALGRAVARIRSGRFIAPGAAVEDDVVAFVEPEALQGAAGGATSSGRDTNGNGQIFESVLRVFFADGTQITSDETPLTVDPTPVIGGQSVAVSGGRVFFRAATADVTPRGTENVTAGGILADTDPHGPSSVATISADGRLVAFASQAPDLVADDTNGNRDVFVRDRLLGTTRRASVRSDGGEAHGASAFRRPHVSADGHVVVFDSNAPDLVPGDTNGIVDVYAHDLNTGMTDRISVASNGQEAHGSQGSFETAVSADGRYVAFASDAIDLVAGDTNGAFDIFVRDRTSGVTRRVSVASNGLEAHGDSAAPAVSADGRFVAFESTADDLVPGDTNASSDIFIHDGCVSNGVAVPGCMPSTDLVSARPDGGPANLGSFNVTISADGELIVFESEASDLVPGDTNGSLDVFARSRGGVTRRISVTSAGVEAHGASFRAHVSADGQTIAFASAAFDLVDDDLNDAIDIFAHDLTTSVTERVVAPAGDFGILTDSPRLSADGRFVAFQSNAGDLVENDLNADFDVFVHDRTEDTTERITVVVPGFSFAASGAPALSADGHLVAFESDAPTLVPADTNGVTDVFVQDRVGGVPDRVSVASGGSEAHGFFGSFLPALSATGQWVAFESDAFDLVPDDTNGTIDVFVHDRTANTTERVSVAANGGDAHGPGGSRFPVISADGRFVAFDSDADDLVRGDTNQLPDVFVRDRATGVTERVSVTSTGAQIHGISIDAALSADGRFVAFETDAPDVVENDTNEALDVFVHDRAMRTTERVSVTSDGRESRATATIVPATPVISADGRFVAFASIAADVVPGDTNGVTDVFVHDRLTGVTDRVSVTSDGDEARSFGDLFSFGSFAPSLSADGRFVAFRSLAPNLAPGDSNGTWDIFVHDRVTGSTVRSSVAPGGGDAHGASISSILAPRPALSADGRTVAFASEARDLVPDDGNLGPDVFTRGPSTVTTQGSVLHVLDAQGGLGTVAALGSATLAVVHGGNAAFLEPDAGTPELRGPLGKVRLSVHGAAPLDLGRAAVALALSDDVLVALISEAAEGADRNGDGDRDDSTVAIHPLGPGAWTDLPQAADTIGAQGTVVAFITPEPAQRRDLNRDHDRRDRVLQAFDAAAGPLIGMGARIRPPSTAEFVLGGERGRELIAIRTPEQNPAADGAGIDRKGRDLNGDGDREDHVLQVFDRERGVLLNTGETIRPCTLEACDPKIPYRVGTNTVTFLTFECDDGHGNLTDPACPPPGGTDLDGNGTANDLIVQTINVRTLTTDVGRAMRDRMMLGATNTGICTTTATACVTNLDCGTGTCFVPPGGCIVDQGRTCELQLTNRINDCQENGQFCSPVPGRPGVGQCLRKLSPGCTRTADCRDPAVSGTDPDAICNASDQKFQRLVNPLTHVGSRRSAGARVFSGAGVCVEDEGMACDPAAGPGRDGCRRGARCEPTPSEAAGGRCRREVRVCTTDGDCPAATTCDYERLVTSTVDDTDGDEIPDPLDNCPTAANSDQRDANQNDVGDACDPSVCPTEPSLISFQCRAVGLVDATIQMVATAEIREALRRKGEAIVKHLDAATVAGRRGRVGLQRADRSLRAYASRLRSRAAQVVPDVTRRLLLELVERLRQDLRAFRSGR